MKDSISKKNISTFDEHFKSCPTHKISRNALTRSQINDIAMDWDAFRLLDHTYSNVIKNEMDTVTNQKSSGRCWGFAGLNLMRISLAKKYNLKNFEFSQKDRSGLNIFVAEAIASFGLVFFILISKKEKIAIVVATYIGSAYWFTSSTSFANPLKHRALYCVGALCENNHVCLSASLHLCRSFGWWGYRSKEESMAARMRGPLILVYI